MFTPILCSSEERPWSWSMRRGRMFEICPRRAFLHYYGTFGGHDVDNATVRVRELHLLKQLVSPSLYLKELLSEALRDIFYGESGENFDGRHALKVEDFLRLVWRRYRQQVGAMWRGDFIHDHRVPIIAQVYFETAPVSEIFKELERELKSILDNPKFLDTIGRLLAIPPLRRIAIESPLSVTLGATPLYCGATIAFKSDDLVVFLDLCSGEPDIIYRDTTMLIHRYYAEIKYNLTPEKVVSSFLDVSVGEEYIPNVFDANFSEALNKISEDRAHQLALVRDNGDVCEIDFACNIERCKYCNFRKECHQSE